MKAPGGTLTGKLHKQSAWLAGCWLCVVSAGCRLLPGAGCRAAGCWLPGVGRRGCRLLPVAGCLSNVGFKLLPSQLCLKLFGKEEPFLFRGGDPLLEACVLGNGVA